MHTPQALRHSPLQILYILYLRSEVEPRSVSSLSFLNDMAFVFPYPEDSDVPPIVVPYYSSPKYDTLRLTALSILRNEMASRCLSLHQTWILPGIQQT